MAINSIDFKDDIVVKRYTVSGDFLTWLGVGSMVRYSGRRERFENERSSLEYYGSNRLPVPELVSSDSSRLEITMKKIPDAKSVIRKINENGLTKFQTLDYIAMCAEALRNIHEYGEHGDSSVNNFLVAGGRIVVIDFERRCIAGRRGDLSSLYLSGIMHCNVSKNEVKSAIMHGYGKEPDEPPVSAKVARILKDPFLRMMYSSTEG